MLDTNPGWKQRYTVSILATDARMEVKGVTAGGAAEQSAATDPKPLSVILA
jgi:hypothetical protein